MAGCARVLERRSVVGGACVTEEFHPGFRNSTAAYSVENEADLVGERRAAAGAVGGELGLVQLDQVLGLSAGTIETVVYPLGRADTQAGDDVADIEPLHGRLDAGDGAALAMPRPGGMPGLGIAAHHRLVVDCSFGPTRVGDLVDLSSQRLGAGQAKDVVDAALLTPSHRLGAGIMAIAPEGGARVGPTPANVPNQAAQMRTNLPRAMGHCARIACQVVHVGYSGRFVGWGWKASVSKRSPRPTDPADQRIG
jgi:hypothetical protein